MCPNQLALNMLNQISWVYALEMSASNFSIQQNELEKTQAKRKWMRPESAKEWRVSMSFE